MVERCGIEAVDGSWVRLGAETLCIHGDAPGAAETARRVRSALQGAGIALRPFDRVNVRVTPFGDSALLLETDDVRTALRITAAIDRARRTGGAPAGIGETVVGMGTVVVHLDDPTGAGDAGPWLQELAAGLDRSEQFDAEPFDDPVAAGGSPPGPRRVDIQVTFDGPDLDEVAERIGATAARVVELLTSAELEVAFLGFAPGFAYLMGLPPALAGVPRRPTPRVSVPGGSVAVAGGFASIYPSTGPGRVAADRSHPDPAVRSRPPAVRAPAPRGHGPLHRPAAPAIAVADALADRLTGRPATEGGLESAADQLAPTRRSR